MSWSDDTRCLYCDGKLALYRKLTNGQFCSAAHKKAYWSEQERLAIERLHQTHDNLQAYRPTKGVENILGKPVRDPYALAMEQETATSPEAPLAHVVEELARKASNYGQVVTPGFLPDSKPKADAGQPTAAFAAAEPIELSTLTVDFLHVFGLQFAAGAGIACLPMGKLVRLPAFAAESSPLAAMDAAPWDAAVSMVHFSEPQFSLAAVGGLEFAPSAGSLPSASKVTIPVSLLTAASLPRSVEVELQFSAIPDLAFLALACAPETPEITGWTPVEISEEEVAVAEVAVAEVAVEIAAPAAVEDIPEAVGVLATPEPAVPEWASVVALPAVSPVASAFAPLVSIEPIIETKWTAQIGSALEIGAPEFEIETAAAPETSEPADPPAAGLVAVPRAESAAALSFTPAAALEPIFAVEAPAVLSLLSQASVNAHTLQPQTGAPLAVLMGAEVEGDFTPRADVAPLPVPFEFDAATIAGLASTGIEAAPMLAGGARYAVREAEIADAPALDISEPAIPAPDMRNAALSAAMGTLERKAALGSKIRLALAGAATPAKAVPSAELALLTPAPEKAILPILRLEPVEGEANPPVKVNLLRPATWVPAHSVDPKELLHHAVDFWKHAPRDLRILAVAIPILIGLALNPGLPKVKVTGPAAGTDISSGLQKRFERRVREQFRLVRQSVAERAAVALNEDFRSGLDEWQTPGDLSTGWSFDRNGFVKPGTLALYRPSMRLTDYEAQFLGLIDKNALSFVARAKDFKNYYVIKLVLAKKGPLPTIGITRYAVIDGKPQDRVDSIAPVTVQPDTLYRVNMVVHGETFLLGLQGQIVDTWSEARLTHGGIGFFAARGEESRLRWVQVTHQYDMLGRLCAYLAPQNIPTTDGSW